MTYLFIFVFYCTELQALRSRRTADFAQGGSYFDGFSVIAPESLFYFLPRKTGNKADGAALKNTVRPHLCRMPDVQNLTLNATISERAVEKLLGYGAMCIEAGEGMRLLNRYLHEISLLASGVPYASLGIGARREKSASVSVFMPDVAGNYVQFQDGGLLTNSTLTKPQSIAVLRLEGVMTSQDDVSSYGVGYLEKQMRAAYANDNIGAVIIETNSPGGEVTAMQMLAGAVQDRNKPVLGFGHFVASAAYGTLAETDEIIASGKLSQFGSIGAVITLDKSFLEFYKENFLSFYGDDAPKKNEIWREALEGNYEPVKREANKATKQFQEQISKARSLTGGAEYQKATLSGAMFDAVEARRRGLVDGIGTLNYAVSRAMSWMEKSKRKRKAA